MSLRLEVLNDEPNPRYDESVPVITLKIYHGGSCNFVPKGNYIGGRISIFDYVDLNFMCFDYLNELVEQLGYGGSKRYYKLDRKRFYFLMYQTDLLQMCDGYITKNRELTLYLEAQIEIPITQIGSSNPLSNDNHFEPDVGGVGDVADESDNSDWSCSTWDFSDSANEGVGDSDSEGEIEKGVGKSNNEGQNKSGGDGETECGGEGENKGGGEGDSDSSSLEEKDIMTSEEDFDSDLGSDEDGGPQFPLFNPCTIFNPVFVIGLLFGNKDEIRQAVRAHAVNTKRSLKITKNDNRRIYARCVSEGCDWKINTLRVGGEKGESTFQIREYNPKHSCTRSYEVKNATSGWLAKKIINKFIADPKRRVGGFRKEVTQELGFDISKGQAYRAKTLALEKIEEHANDQYKQLWDYAEKLRRTNPGSTVIMQMAEGDDQEGRKFDKFYVGLAGLRKGFMSGCRPIIGVDGTHLKGPHGGVLLTSVSVDPNNNLFPISYDVVSGETKIAWEWFLMLLKEDLNIMRDDSITFLSDKQKGLIPAFEKVFPGADNRFCIRHLHGNMKRAGFRGLAHKLALWNAAKASTMSDFELRMQELGQLDAKTLEWLNDTPPTQWSRSHFCTFPKCDMLLNNVCETLNSNILDARKKPILTMLEWIRQYLMTRLQENRDKARRMWQGRLRLCPRIRKIVDRHMDRTSDCIPIKSDDLHYAVECYDLQRFTIDLQNHNCSCRKWELTGIPCPHAMSAICRQKLDPEDFVHVAYTVDTYLKVYEHSILPINGPRLWAKTGFIPPIPPNFGRSVGKPARARRLEPDELVRKTKKGIRKQKQPIKMKKQPYNVKCKYCGEKGHNIKGCDVRKIVEAALGEDMPLSEDFTANQWTSAQEIGTASSSTSHKMTKNKRASSSTEVTNPSAMMPPPVPIPAATPVPLLMKGGKKYVTMSNLTAAVFSTNQRNKEKSKRDGKKKMPPWK
ncbi:hypothetical protein BUALT_Bualt11G0002900 [Buddleja alternifolia]|uniref:SWIM-type domain-containing protein n=1 Tax=Buddleja alternifolia TaxID=168488 RepID=A0AAV6X297_9LAMI|nr:hypothetical protein BUALT_Bualt11G0002900 [Buddleja alternifolia]